MFFTKYFTLLLTVSVGLVSLSIAANAEAAEVSGYVSQIDYELNSPGTPYMNIQVNGSSTNYLAPTYTVGSCPAIDSDTMRAYLAQLQAALLSGLNVNIYYTVCNSLNVIHGVVLQ